MSDPFSIALGVITVIDVTAKCAKTLNTLIREYKHAPDEVLALNNEIEDYRLVLSQLEDAATQIRSPATLSRLDKILVEAENKVNELQDLVVLFEQKARKGKLSLFKTWKKRRREVGEWRDEVGRLKQDVVIIMGAETSYVPINKLSSRTYDFNFYLISKCRIACLLRGSNHPWMGFR